MVGGGIMMDGKLFSIHTNERKSQPELSKVRIPFANFQSLKDTEYCYISYQHLTWNTKGIYSNWPGAGFNRYVACFN